MRVEFLGHGLHGSYLNTVGDWIKSTFNDSDYYSFVGFSAFTKMSGINMIKKELLIAKQNYNSIKFYLGIVRKGTSKEALDFFLENEIETYVYSTEEPLMFHPKIFFFEGKHNSRFIIGSSNLTRPGLFENIEASTLFEFSNKDLVGKKFIKQYQNYFSSILDNSNIDTQLLTKEVLQDFIDSGFVFEERHTRDENDFSKFNKKLSDKRRKRKFNKEGIGQQTTEIKPEITFSKNEIPPITQEYLDSWNYYFELFKEFKKENQHKGDRFSVTIPRDYKNASLYGWYRRQKIYAKNNMLPEEHKILLEKEKFYFKDAHILWQEYLQEIKLEVLVEALIANEDIRVNHRYEFNGVRLGTWLVEINQANKKGKKLELRQQILELGFDMSATSRNPTDSAKRFLSDLLEAKDPDKMRFQSRFNGTIRDRINEIPEDILQAIDEAWFLQFNEIRVRGRIRERHKDRTIEWKEFRYNESVNPEKKWLSTFKKMGDLYYWARLKRENKSRMDLIKHHFTDTEKEELRKEKFKI